MLMIAYSVISFFFCLFLRCGHEVSVSYSNSINGMYVYNAFGNKRFPYNCLNRATTPYHLFLPFQLVNIVNKIVTSCELRYYFWFMPPFICRAPLRRGPRYPYVGPEKKASRGHGPPGFAVT